MILMQMQEKPNTAYPNYTIFALSSIIVLIWGNNMLSTDPAETKSPTESYWMMKEVTSRIVHHKITGVKLGVISMMGGFTWIIISMIIFVMIIFKY
jgi:hypothetical protein